MTTPDARDGGQSKYGWKQAVRDLLLAFTVFKGSAILIERNPELYAYIAMAGALVACFVCLPALLVGTVVESEG